MVITALLFALLRKSRKNADFQRLLVFISSFFQNPKPSLKVQLHPRLSAGLGSGISKYDHLMLPVFATFHWHVSNPHRFTPFLGCNIGHAFAPKKHVNGGFYLSPSVGVSYKLKGRHSLSLSVGYELQEYSQLLSFENARFLTQYVEDISNHAITASIGFTF